MNTLETWGHIEVLGWALIHFTWQGTLVALSLAGVLRMLRRSSTNTRYAAACVALLLMSSLPLFTIAIIGHSTPDKTASGPPPQFTARPASQPQPVEIEPAIVPTQTNIALASPRPWSFIRPAPITPMLPWMILLWLLGVVFFSLRMAGGWLYTQRLKSYGTRPLGEGWEQTLLRLCDQLRAPRPARLLESALVKVPMVVGWLRPVILLPTSALTGLSPQQLEAIIAHELAHIRRHDYLINLLQAVVETLLFYHPAVWWVSRRIRQEREHCCDDMAVAVCGDALTYARALLEMEQLRAAGPQLAVAANGGSLMNRIQRLVGAQPKQANRFGGLFAGVITLTILISAVAGAQILLQSSNSADREIISASEREAMKGAAAAETPGKSNGVDAGQQTGSVQDDRAAEDLLSTLQSASWDVRKAAVERLAHIRGGRAVDLLIAALKDEHVQVREQAVIGLGIRQDERLVWALIAPLTDRDWQVRKQAAIALGKLSDEHAAEPPLKALLDSEWAVREQAARAVGAAGKREAVEPLITALQDQHEQVREAAAKTLGIIGNRRALVPLNLALQDADEQVRKNAIEALDLLKQSGRDFSMSINALQSSNAMQRAFAARSLGRLGAFEAIPALINLLGDDTPIRLIKYLDSGDWSPARHEFKQASPGEQAAIALAALSQPAVEPLIAALNNGNPSVRRNAAWAIGEIRGGLVTDRTAAVEPLIATLSDEDSWVRVAAAYSLGEMGPSQATESLVAALGDAEWSVRGMAARALGKMKAHAAVERLKSLSLRDENEEVRRKAVQALGEIGESLDQSSTAQKSRDYRGAGSLSGVTRTLEIKLQANQSGKVARLKINGQINSGSCVWTLRDPNGKSAFTAESNNGELSLDSGDLDAIPGTWILKLEVDVKNGTIDFKTHWNTR
ncbi:MAG TPA: HEAT repeat domain-containing protein [Blastocatellia bacterium]|nr:HEAT repeat domain-containing protein [Blastocatellia bacterium]